MKILKKNLKRVGLAFCFAAVMTSTAVMSAGWFQPDAPETEYSDVMYGDVMGVSPHPTDEGSCVISFFTHDELVVIQETGEDCEFYRTSERILYGGDIQHHVLRRY